MACRGRIYLHMEGWARWRSNAALHKCEGALHGPQQVALLRAALVLERRPACASVTCDDKHISDAQQLSNVSSKSTPGTHVITDHTH